MKKTIIINLFAGPGAGKSTLMSGLFYKLKTDGYNCEMATEFAKDLTWEKRFNTLEDQIYVFGKQQHRIYRLIGSVDIIITDSPILLSYFYGPDNPELRGLVLSEFNKYENINFYVHRVKKYNPAGRSQTEDEARELDGTISARLIKLNVPFTIIPGNELGLEQAYKDILLYLEKYR